MGSSPVQNKFQWYWNRLRAMSPEEIVVRAELALKKKNWRSRKSWIAPKPNLVSKDVWELLPLPPEAASERQELLAEASRYLRGEYTLLNLSYSEPKIDWHFDPQTGKRSPLEFGLDLDYRDRSLVGNFKNIWEKSRHHHLTVLACAWAITKDSRYAVAVEEQLLSWAEQNPFPVGVNWTSSLEFAVRLISWVWIDRPLRGTPSHARLFGEEGALWQTIYWHQWMISQYYSHGSSANNHLVGEMAGLFIAAAVWPVFSESASWQSLARRILEREVAKQTFPSGLNREQAFSYHIFTLEFFLLAGLEAERLGIRFTKAYQDWVQKMLEVIPPLRDVGGNTPQYGDADEGMALQIRPLGSSRLDWLFRIGRQWLGAKVPLPKNNSGLLAATLMGINAEDKVGEVKHPQGSVAFNDAGLFVLAYRRGEPDEVFCLADAGLLGYLSIAAHGQADALSFTLSVRGVPVIVDPGTYVYHGEPEWRTYFRGTKGHNTMVVDGVDQSEPGGTFLWTSKAESKVLSWEATPEGGVLVAEHDGYQRLPNGVIHRRRLMLKGRQLEIDDDLLGSGVHDLEWRLHFSPQCTVNLEQLFCKVSWEGGNLTIKLDSQMQWVLGKGEQEAGWYSPGFNLKQPTYTLVGAARTTVPASIKNCLDITGEE